MNHTLNISIDKCDRTIAIKPCKKERDGQFIRELTKAKDKIQLTTPN